MSGLQFRKTALGRSLFLGELASGLLTCFPDLRRVWTVGVDPNLTSVGTSAGFNALGPKRYSARLPKGKQLCAGSPLEMKASSTALFTPVKNSCRPMF